MEEIYGILIEVAIDVIKYRWGKRRVQGQEQIIIASPIIGRKYKRRSIKHHL